MAVTQYIGARYVPIFAEPVQWSNDRNYEPLTIVMYQGASYTSRQAVPIGIDITNEDFWVCSGNYNAQVEQYRQELLRYEQSTTEEITSLNNQISISVEKYGAIGDGVTDDTLAIQQAIAENPNNKIVFTGKSYLVSDTIHCWGSRGGCDIDLCGATIIWDGSNNIPMFQIDNSYALNDDDYLYPYLSLSPTEGFCHIHNGVISHASIGILSKGFHTVIDDLKVYGCTKYGIQIGTSTNQQSQGAMVSNVLIMKSRNNDVWSEEVDVTAGMTLDNASAALVVYDSDNIFSNINTNRYANGVIIAGSPQLFLNCHFTAQYKEPRNNLAETAAINMKMVSASTSAACVFTNIYCDNNKYFMYASRMVQVRCDISNSLYFNSDRQVISIENGGPEYFDAYMTHPNIQYISINQLQINCGSRCRFFDAAIVHSVNLKVQSLANVNQNYINTVLSNSDAAFLPYVAKFLTKGEYVNVIPSNFTGVTGTNYCVGAIVMGGTSVARFCTVNIEIELPRHLMYKGRLYHNGSVYTLADEYCEGTNRSHFDLYIGEPKIVEFFGNQCSVFPLYFHANDNFTNQVYMSLNSHDSLICCYLNSGSVNTTYSSTNFLIQKSFT